MALDLVSLSILCVLLHRCIRSVRTARLNMLFYTCLDSSTFCARFRLKATTELCNMKFSKTEYKILKLIARRFNQSTCFQLDIFIPVLLPFCDNICLILNEFSGRRIYNATTTNEHHIITPPPLSHKQNNKQLVSF